LFWVFCCCLFAWDRLIHLLFYFVQYNTVQYNMKYFSLLITSCDFYPL
jgi:hypothetical protein